MQLRRVDARYTVGALSSVSRDPMQERAFQD